jgi:NADH:ubiquinone oxidoreductase subunit E
MAICVVSDDAKRDDPGPQGCKVCRNVPCTAQGFTFLLKGHHWHRHLGRKFAGITPEIAVEHQIAEDADVLASQFWQKAL